MKHRFEPRFPLLYFSLRALALLVCGWSLVCGGCRRGPKRLAVSTAQQARTAALGSAVLPNLDRSFERVEGVARALSLPFDKAEQRQSLLQSLQVPEAVTKAVRTDLPMALVAFAPKQPGKEPEVVVAARAKSSGALTSAVASLGQPVASQDDAMSFKVEGDRPVWVWRKDETVVAASSLETLVLGASLAMELAASAEEDMSVRVSPEAIAKAQGTDLKSAIAGWLANVSSSLGTMPGQNPMATIALAGMMKAIGDRVAEVEEAALSLRLDPAKGATLRLALSPRKQSTLAAMLGKATPYQLDGRVLPEGDVMALMAFSPTEILTRLWAELRPLVAKGPAGEEAAKQIDTLAGGWSVGGSAALSIVDRQIRMAGVYGMKPGTDRQAFLAAMAGLMEGAWYQSMLAAGEAKSKVSVKRDKDALVITTSTQPTENLAMAAALERMGLLSQAYAVLVEGNAMYCASGKNATQAARQLVSAPPRKPTGLCAQAVAESSGADGFFFMDIAQLVKIGVESLGAGQGSPFSDLRLPFWATLRGGQTATLELRVPIELGKGVVAFAPLLMGMGLGQKGMLAP